MAGCWPRRADDHFDSGPRATGREPPRCLSTIGAALAEAADGTVITIADGLYRETVELGGLRVTLAAADGATVLVDGTGGDRPVFRVSGGSLALRGIGLRAGGGPAVVTENAALTVHRCTISGGRGPAIGIRGSAAFEVTGCAISATEQGVVVEGASGRLEDTTIEDVTGDGITVGMGADPVIRNCTVTGCGLRGVYVYQYARPVIEGCAISHTGLEGVAVAHHGTPVLRRCTISDARGADIAFASGCGGNSRIRR